MIVMFFIGTDAFNRELRKFGEKSGKADRKSYIDLLAGYTFIIPVFVIPYLIAVFFFEVSDFSS